MRARSSWATKSSTTWTWRTGEEWDEVCSSHRSPDPLIPTRSAVQHQRQASLHIRQNLVGVFEGVLRLAV